MLNKKQVAELKEAVKRVDIDKALQEAKDMGIGVTEKKLGFHGIYNEYGQLEKLNLEKHLVIGKEREPKYLYSYSESDKKDMTKNSYVLAV